MRKFFGLLGALLLVTGAVGCSSSGGDDKADVTTTTEQDGGTTSTTAGDETSTTEGDETTTTEGGGGGGDAAEFASRLEEGFLDGEAAAGQIEMGSDSAVCLAERWVDIIGVDQFQENDVAPDDLSDPEFDFTGLGLSVDQGEQMVGAAADCDVDIRAQFLAVMTAGLTATQGACLEDALDGDVIDQIIVEGLTSEEPSSDLQATLDGLEQTCQLSG